MNEIINTIVSVYNSVIVFIKNLTGEQIALLSLFVSLVLYLLGKRYDFKLKKYMAKKEQYEKLAKLIVGVLLHGESLIENVEFQSERYEMESYFVIYGSRKICKNYTLLDLANKNSKYYRDGIAEYLLVRILKIIRKEVGLNVFSDINCSELMAIPKSIPDDSVPLYKNNHVMAYCIMMLRIEHFFEKLTRHVYSSAFYYHAIKPIFGLLWVVVRYIIIQPAILLYKSLFKREKPNRNPRTLGSSSGTT